MTRRALAAQLRRLGFSRWRAYSMSWELQRLARDVAQFVPSDVAEALLRLQYQHQKVRGDAQ